MNTSYRLFWIALGAWLGSLVAAFNGYWLLARNPRLDVTPLFVVELEVGFVGTMLLFSLFPATLALRLEDWSQARSRLRGLVVRLAAVVALALALLTFVMPQIKYARVAADPEVAVEERLPFGPSTLVGLLRHRAYAVENPPAEPSLAVGTPLRTPVNHLDHTIHSQLAAGMLGLLGGLLGLVVGLATVDIRARHRRWLHWAVGLASPAAFIWGSGVGQQMIIRSTETSGVLTGWAPVVPHALAVALLLWMHRRKAGTTGSGGSGDGIVESRG